MNELYLDCKMGASEQAIYKALLELHPHPDQFVTRLHTDPMLSDTVRKSTELLFSELGRVDVAERRYVLGVCLLMEELEIGHTVVSPINIGIGRDFYANKLLQGIPVFKCDNRNIRCTTAAAALVTFYANEFAELSFEDADSIGYGADGEILVCARVSDIE